MTLVNGPAEGLKTIHFVLIRCCLVGFFFLFLFYFRGAEGRVGVAVEEDAREAELLQKDEGLKISKIFRVRL